MTTSIDELSKKLDFQSKVNRITWPFRWFYQWVVKSAQYSWVLRPDIDWDWTSILRLLQYKLSRVRKDLNDDPWSSDKRRRESNKELRTCELLLQRLIDDDYFMVPYDKLTTKWEGKYSIFPNSINNLTDAEQVQYRRELEAMIDYETNMQKQDIELFCKIFSRKLRSWWT